MEMTSGKGSTLVCPLLRTSHWKIKAQVKVKGREDAESDQLLLNLHHLVGKTVRCASTVDYEIFIPSAAQE